MMYEIKVNSSWLDTNCIWYYIFNIFRYLSRISDTFLATSSANGKIAIINLEKKKNYVTNEIDLTLPR